jgi:serine/threonine-protein kinase
MVGRVLGGRFTILARIGAGSMGTVYRARQAPFGRDVAIKILRSDRAIDEVSRNRFSREARANSLLTSPNTVTVYDFGQSDSGDFFLAMELLEGESLGQRIRRVGRMSADCAIDVGQQALHSLAEAHAKGIIHRDLKPDNLFFARVRTNETYEEIVKVLDFGIAKMLHADGQSAISAVETQAGTVFGTPRYMSPEQAQGRPLDARSDLYSLGVILYHALAGRPPFTDDDAIVVMARHIKTAPRPLSEVAPDAHVPAELESLVMRVLSKSPDRRPQSAEVMMGELARAREVPAVSSGVRTSLGLDAIRERPTPVAPTRPITSGRERAAADLPYQRSRRLRWLLRATIGGRNWAIAAILLGLALTSIGLVLFRAHTPSSSASPSDVVRVVVAPAPTAADLPPLEATSNAIPSAAADPQPTAGPPASPASRLEGRRARPIRPGSANPKPPGNTSVGYGYLE